MATLTNTIKKTMKLRVTETQNKAGKFLYEVVDDNGNVISSRRSNRVYVACTVSGGMFFGRLDLIGKGDHGRVLKYCYSKLNMSEEQYKSHYRHNTTSYEDFQNEAREDLKALTTIAYL